MNRRKLHNTVEYIKSRDEFPFDAEDVNQDVARVLTFFGIDEEFVPEEFRVLRKELMNLALEAEWAEIERLVVETQDS